MDHIAFPYRSASHLALLHVVAASGAWEKYGLDVDYNRVISRADAHEAVTSGAIEFVGGNHVSTYGKRARGSDWVYVGQTMNVVYGRQLAVRPESGINSVADLKHKKIGTQGNHPGLNDWLYLKQRGLDVDRDDVELLDAKKIGLKVAIAEGEIPRQSELWEAVLDKRVDAAFLSPPATFFAANAGLKLIDIEPMPMIFFTTLSTSARFVEAHPDIVERFLKGMIEGVHFFKTKPQESTSIILERFGEEGRLDATMAATIYNNLAPALEPKLFPTLEAMSNVYQEGVRLDPEAAKVNPVELWDLHIVRALDDAGFVRDLYQEPAVK